MTLPTDPITDFEHAFTEGWTLEPCFQNGQPIWLIERRDQSAQFDDDLAALAFVQERAWAGSVYHQHALALDGQPRPAWVPAMGLPSAA